MTRIRIVAIDDHPLILSAVRSSLRARADIEFVAEGYVGDDVLRLLKTHRPDVLLLDQRMPQSIDPDNQDRFKILPTLRKIKRDYPDVRIIILSAWAEPVMIHQALKAGVSGYVSKSDANLDIADAIKLVVNNGLFLSESAHEAYSRRAATDLSNRQIEVLAAINHAPEADYASLAEELGMSESTFKKHLTIAMRRLGVPNNKLAAIKMAETIGLF